MFDRFWLLVIFSIIAVVASTRSSENNHGAPARKWSCVFLCIIFILQAGLRDWENQINDTLNYARMYYALEDLSLRELVKSSTFFAEEYVDRDPGYNIFVKITQFIAFDFQFFLVIVATIISVPICHILYKYSTSIAGIFLGACLYEALFAPFFETGIRQTLAMGFTFMALELFLNKKYIWWILLTVFAYTLHTSSLIFLPVYLFLKWGKPKFILATCILLAPIFMIFSKQVMFFLGEGTIMSNYVSLTTMDNKGTPVFSALVVVSVISTYFLGNRIKENYKYYKLMFISMAFAIMLVPTTWVNSNFLRLELYYLTFLMPLISVLIDAYTRNRRALTIPYYFSLALALIILTA